MADTVIFLELSFDGRQLVAGSAETTGFVDRIEIESFSWGAGANHNETNQQRASRDETPLKMQSIELSKFYDRASVQITTGAAQRRHVERALLSFISLPLREDGRAPARLMEMEMKDGFIERVRLTGLPVGAEVDRLRVAYEDVAARLDALTRAKAFIAALPLVDALEARLRDLEACRTGPAAGGGQDGPPGQPGTAAAAGAGETAKARAGQRPAQTKPAIQEADEEGYEEYAEHEGDEKDKEDERDKERREAEQREFARSRWEQEMASSQHYIANVVDCGPVEAALDELRAAFIEALERARDLGRVGLHTHALAMFEAARVDGSRFLSGKATLDARRARELNALRETGAGSVPLLDLSGEALGAKAAATAIGQAMAADRDLRKSRGLIALVDESRRVDALFASCRVMSSSVTVRKTMQAIDGLLTLAGAYMARHPSGSGMEPWACRRSSCWSTASGARHRARARRWSVRRRWHRRRRRRGRAAGAGGGSPSRCAASRCGPVSAGGCGRAGRRHRARRRHHRRRRWWMGPRARMAARPFRPFRPVRPRAPGRPGDRRCRHLGGIAGSTSVGR